MIKLFVILLVLHTICGKILYEDEQFLLQFEENAYDDRVVDFCLSFNPQEWETATMCLKFGRQISPMDQIRVHWDTQAENYSIYDEYVPHGLFYSRSRRDKQQNLQGLQIFQNQEDLTEICFQRELKTADDTQDLALDQLMIFEVSFLSADNKIIASKIFSRDLSLPDISELDSRILTVTGDVAALSSYIDVYSHKLYWSIDATAQTITFLLETDLQGYVGIGFREGMNGVDMAIIQYYSGASPVNSIDYYSSSESTPSQDTTQDFTIDGYEITSNRLKKIKFTRALTSSDTTQDQNIVPDQTVTWAFAERSGSSFSEHSRRSNIQFVLCSSCEGQQASKTVDGDETLDAHRIFLTIGWGVWVDLLVILTQYMKHKNFYTDVHAVMALLLDVGSIVVIALMIDRGGSMKGTNAEAHEVIGIIFLALVCAHHVGGGIIKYQLTIDDTDQKNLKDSMHKLKKAHFASGFILYVLGKVQLFTGVANYMKIDPETTSTLMIVYQVLIIALIKIAPDITFRYTKKKIGHVPLEDSQRPEKIGDYDKILQMIQDNVDRHQILSTYPDARYVIYQGALYHVENFNHSGGKYILDQVLGREVDCFLYGGYSLESSDLDSRTHSHYAAQVLAERFQGTIEIPENQNLFENQISTLKKNEFKLVKKQKISNIVGIFYLQGQGTGIKNQLRGVRWFGRHFTIWDSQQSDPKRRLYTTVLCMTEQNQEQQRQLLSFAESGFKDPLKLTSSPRSETLPLIIKRYQNNDAFSKLIHYAQEGKSVFYLDGPHGLGLQLTEQSQGLFVIFVGGTGILPFLDLFYFLFKLAITRIAEQQKISLSSELLDKSEGFVNPIKFLVYGSFQSQDDIVGIDFLECLNRLNQAYNLNLIEFKFKVSATTKQSKLQTIAPLTQSFNKEFIESQFLLWKNISRVYICGPPKMNRTLQEGLISMNLKNKIFFV